MSINNAVGKISTRGNPGINNPGMEEKGRGVCAVLASIEGFGAVDFGKVNVGLGGTQEVLEASENDLVGVGISEKKAKLVVEKLQQIEPEEYLDELGQKGIRIVVYGDKDYPKLLAETKEAPFVLWVRGEGEFSPLSVAVVGTRKPSSYGVAAAQKLVGELAAAGVTIVSGLAYGIDAVAHRACVDAGGKTVAVLGSGIDVIQPASNAKMAGEIESHGLVISEYGPGVPGRVQNFPARNRIVSGLAQGVLVIEGAQGSGTLITVDFAKAQERMVMAVPGMITNPMSMAPNGLIKEGAVVVTEAQDILDKLDGWGGKHGEKKELEVADFGNELAWKIYECLGGGEKSGDEIAKELKISGGEVSAELTMLELEARVARSGGKYRRS